MPTRAKWYPLYEENEDFKLWFDNLARGSPNTAVENARVLFRYMKIKNLTLDELTNHMKDNVDMFEKRFMDFIGKLEHEGYSPGYIQNYVKTIKSWANWHRVKLIRKIKISNSNHTPTLDNEKVPTVQQVKDIRSNASLRGRICVGALAYAGLRPEVLGHQRYEDGLKLGDLPELDIEKLEFTQVPTQVVVRPELSKAGHAFRTFFPEPVCRDIITYLQRRKGLGEELDEISPLVAVSYSHRLKGQRVVQGRSTGHIVTAIVSRDIRRAMRPTYEYRPYVLRSFFSTRLLIAESDGALDSNMRSYWMGHQGNMSARYSSNKALLPDDLIENMRQSYNRCESYLLGGTVDEDSLRKKMLVDYARMLNSPEHVISQIQSIVDKSANADEAIREITRSGLSVVRQGESQREFRKGLDVGSGEFVVVNGIDNLQLYERKGWSLVEELSAESSKDNLDDELWMMPDGTKINASNKVYALIDDVRDIEMRGHSEVLDSIEDELHKTGVSTKHRKIRRFLLKKS
jgi:hypothetical protein